MGASEVQSFDNNWLFARFGLQADGTTKKQPGSLETTNFNDSDWRKLDLPHDWAIEGPFRIELAGETGKLPYQGIGWYRKHFSIPAGDIGKHIFLDFDGAMAYAEIWLNGSYVGTWPYGYTSFRMDLTPYLKFGQQNVIAVKLNTEKWESRWYPGAGIYRHVWLVKTDPVHVAHWGTCITTPEITDASASVKMEIKIENQSNTPVNAKVSTEIYELDNQNRQSSKVGAFNEANLTLVDGTSGTAQVQATISHPKRWDLDAPNRYLAVTIIRVNGKEVDRYFTSFGIRTLEFTARNGFLLNGRRVPIQGTCNHHDLGALGAAINTTALRRQLSILKTMGCNALRTSHNPPAPELLDLADQMGFLVWDEAFDAWKTGKRDLDYNKLFDDWHEKDLTALVHRDRNHPSVIIWSIGNEVEDQRNVEMTKHLADIVQREDPTRPVSNGYNDPDGSREVGSAKAMGIMGVNYFFSRQGEWDADPRYANMPTMGSETSSCITSRGEYFFGNQYQNWQISSYDNTAPDWGCIPDTQFRTNHKYPHLLGEFVWTGFDYLGEPTPYYSNNVDLSSLRNDPSKKEELEKKLKEISAKTPPSRSSYFGIVDLCGFPKDRFYLYQSQWRPDYPMAHILPHWNWPERLDSIVPVQVYTSGDEAELFLNGKSLGKKSKVAGQDFRLVWPDVKYKQGELKVVAYKNGERWAEDKVVTTEKAAKLALEADKNEIEADGSDLVYVTVKVQDQNGLTVPRSKPALQFSVKGEGEILATDNGDPTDFTPFRSLQRNAFNGMALVILKAQKGGKGAITLTASNDGLAGDQITLKIK